MKGTRKLNNTEIRSVSAKWRSIALTINLFRLRRRA